MFKSNVDDKESLLRLIAGAVLLGLGLLSTGFIQVIFALGAVVLIVTGAVRWCPVYSAMKKPKSRK